MAPPEVSLEGWIRKNSCTGVDTLMSNEALVPLARPVEEAVSVYFGLAPVGLSMLRLENVAIPASADLVTDPDRVAVGSPVPLVIATLMLLLNVGTRFPCASSAETFTAGLMVAPVVVAVGCTVKTSWLAAAGVMLNGTLAAEVNGAVVWM